MHHMSRAMLIPFWGLALAMGLGYIFGGAQRFQSAAFGPAKSLMPMHWWGVVFLIGALAVGVTSIFGYQRWTARALLVGGAIYLWWGVLFGIATITDHEAAMAGFWVYGFIAYAHWLAKYRIVTEIKVNERAFQRALKELRSQ